MPWQECSKVDERLKFVARLLDGEKMAVLCREFDISRKTGYKIYSRYKECGLEGLTDRCRRPYRQANSCPSRSRRLIVQLKKEHPAGVPRRSARRSAAGTARSACRPSAPCTRSSIGIAW